MFKAGLFKPGLFETGGLGALALRRFAFEALLLQPRLFGLFAIPAFVFKTGLFKTGGFGAFTHKTFAFETLLLQPRRFAAQGLDARVLVGAGSGHGRSLTLGFVAQALLLADMLDEALFFLRARQGLLDGRAHLRFGFGGRRLAHHRR
ncbi:MAG: hypothetical protein WDN06_14105 [Asticcacaulis sp.]